MHATAYRLRVAGADRCAMSRKSCKSVGRRLAVMNLWNGSMASRSPSISPTRPSVSGSNPVTQASFSTGCITKNVRNIASPISTILGGVPCVASALRNSDSTMMMRVKAVTITSKLGASDNTVTSAVICTSRPVAPAWPAAPRSIFSDCACATIGSSRRQLVQPIPRQYFMPGFMPAARLVAIQPADHDILWAAGQQQHASFAAFDQMQSASRVERHHVLHRQQTSVGGAL